MKAVSILKFIFFSSAITMIACAIIIYPERYISTCFSGFALWAECVLPSLFPFMVIALIAIKSGFAQKAALPMRYIMRPLRLPPVAATCLLISICSGYPAGSRCVLEYFENGGIGKSDCKKLAILCSTSGPLFVIGSVGAKMLSDKYAGIKIFLAHIISVIVIAVIFSLLTEKREKMQFKPMPTSKNLLYDCFYGAIVSVAVAGGFIAFFAVVGRILVDFNFTLLIEKFLSLFVSAQCAKGVSLGLVEVTSGCLVLSDGGGNLQLPFMGFLITFGGISIILQQLSYLTQTGIKPFRFISVKFTQAALCFLFLLICP